ncbi:MAG: hypothetical protein HGA31_00665 [Candidatus Moranbacteria bacterium]|nr:hypothetical protein [Candidatus Moranbacteria bacterium]
MLSRTFFPRDKNTDEFSLSDLDVLVPGLGTEILKQIDSVQDRHSMNAAKETISTLLERHGTRMEDIFIDQGDCSGHNLEIAFESTAYNHKLQDRLRG